MLLEGICGSLIIAWIKLDGPQKYQHVDSGYLPK